MLQIYENASFGDDHSVASESRLAKSDNDNSTLQICENAGFGADQFVYPGEYVLFCLKKLSVHSPEIERNQNKWHGLQ